MPSTHDIPELALFPAEQRYDCLGCGQCCSGVLTVPVTAEEAARIRAPAWAGEMPEESFVQEGGKLRLAHRVDGACVFLDGTPWDPAEGTGAPCRCRIHARFGEAAKPLACRLYPFVPVPFDGTVRLDLRFGCPAVAANIGQPLAGHRAWLAELLPLLTLHDGAPPPQTAKQAPMRPAHVARVTAEFMALLDDAQRPPVQRLLACLALADELRALYLAALDDASLAKVLATYRSQAEAWADAHGERRQPGALVRAAFRQLLALYGQEERHGARRTPLARLVGYAQSLFGGRTVAPLRADFPRVPTEDVEGATGPLPAETWEPLLRALRVRLRSLGFFGARCYDLPYLDGVAALLLTAPLTLWLARAYAASRALPVPDAACVVRATRIIQQAHGYTPGLALPTQRERLTLLIKREALRDLLTWYGT
jgi:lysine-N-methylase